MTGLPVNALPQLDRANRGMHSYTVSTSVKVHDEIHEVVIDVLLRNQAFYIKKAVPGLGKCGQVSWKKSSGAHNAWCIALDRAKCGNVCAAHPDDE